MSEWLDIETAPKDGTEILGYRADAGVMMIRFTSCDAFLTDAEMAAEKMDEETIFAQDWFFADFVHGGRLVDNEIPTHWMPLPAPPEQPERVEG